MTSKALTSQTSVKFDPYLHNGLWNIRSCMKITVIIFILHLLAAPAVYISCFYNIKNHIASTPSESILVIAAIATGVAGALGIFIAFMNFGSLYNKNKSDMYLSAPLSMKQRFFSDYLSGLVSYIVPFIAAQIPSLILIAVGHFGFDGKKFTIIEKISDERIIETSYICEFFGEYFPAYCRIAVGGILAMIMLYTLTVLIMTCCGTLFDGIVHTVLINVFSFLAVYCSFNTVYDSDYSFMVNFNKQFMHILAWTSPAGAVITLVTGLGENLFAYKSVPLWSWAAGVIVFIAITFAAAYYLYKKRRAEQLSKPIVFRWIYGLMMTLVLCFVIAYFLKEQYLKNYVFEKQFFTVLLCSFMGYLICEIVSNRGLKKLWKGAVRFAVSFAAISVCFAVVISTRFFGVEYYVPSADEVEKIYLGYNGIYSGYSDDINTYFSYYGGDGSDGRVYVIEDRDNIENIIAAQNSIVATIKNAAKNSGISDWYSWNYENEEPLASRDISVCCELKNGKRVTRKYDFVNAEAIQYLMKIDISEEFKQQTAEHLKNSFIPFNELLEEFRRQANYALEDPTAVSVNLSITSPMSLSSCGTGKVMPMTEKFYNELRDALVNDIINRTADEYFTPCSDRKYTITVGGVFNDYHINGCYDETLKVLAAYNCFEGLGTGSDDILDESITLPTRTIKICKGTLDYRAAASWLAYCKKENMTNREYSELVNGDSNVQKSIIHYSDDLRTLFEVMQFRYVTDELVYRIMINGESYYIPPEYSDIAERVYNSAENPNNYPEGTNIYYSIGAQSEGINAHEID